MSARMLSLTTIVVAPGVTALFVAEKKVQCKPAKS